MEWRLVEIKPGFLHCASRRVRTEANARKRRRLASVGMTGYMGRLRCGGGLGVARPEENFVCGGGFQRFLRRDGLGDFDFSFAEAAGLADLASAIFLRTRGGRILLVTL